MFTDGRRWGQSFVGLVRSGSAALAGSRSMRRSRAASRPGPPMKASLLSPGPQIERSLPGPPNCTSVPGPPMKMPLPSSPIRTSLPQGRSGRRFLAADLEIRVVQAPGSGGDGTSGGRMRGSFVSIIVPLHQHLMIRAADLIRPPRRGGLISAPRKDGRQRRGDRPLHHRTHVVQSSACRRIPLCPPMVSSCASLSGVLSVHLGSESRLRRLFDMVIAQVSAEGSIEPSIG